jgi:hypothetical protein
MSDYFLFQHKPGFMREEIFATWFATGLIILVVGTNFTSRDSVTIETRRIVDCLFIALALLILLWSGMSFFNLMSFSLHRMVLLVILLASLASLCYLMYLSAVQQL